MKLCIRCESVENAIRELEERYKVFLEERNERSPAILELKAKLETYERLYHQTVLTAIERIQKLEAEIERLKAERAKLG